MKKIAIIGANGYIARNLIHVLKRDYPDYELDLYGRSARSIDNYDHYRSVDLCSRELVKMIDLSCDIVFQLAGRTGSANGFVEYDSFIDSNERALLNLLDEYRNQNSTARLVFPSTRLVYKGKPKAQKEDAEKEFKTVYAISKYACEQYLEQFNRAFSVQYTIFRICVPYGTLVPNASSYGTAEFMLSKATKGEAITLYGDGTVRRTLTYIEDICRTMIIGALSPACMNDVFNIGGEDYSLCEMADLIAARFGVDVEYIPWPDLALKIESGDTVFDSEKLDSTIGRYIKSKFRDWVAQA